ncbi:MAG: hypothetical protein JWR38_5926 [Mucilaginibacter sp.]|nr:hypothetical protein [Mucilaginibacter sp.]
MPKHHNKTTILFGAGAVLSWNAPSTAELTDLVLSSGYYMTDNSTRITKFIYTTLIEDCNYPKEFVNFETIINVIEELIVYYSYFNSGKKIKSIQQAFFQERFLTLLNFGIEGNNITNGFKLEIPKGFKSEYANRANNDVTPGQHFFQNLLSELLTAIQSRISNYAYHTKSHSVVLSEQNKEINTLFSKWIAKSIGNDCLRMYTLNYDRNFKIILENSDTPLEIFEGFDCGREIDYNSYIPANIPKVLIDTTSNVHYNLHGSAFWHVEPLDEHQLPNPKFYLTTGIDLAVNNDYPYPTYQSEIGKTILLSNIVTGYQKTQKSSLTPFKQMQAAFDRDCCFSDTVVIVGYSFNDEHINTGIKAAIQYSPHTKFIIVDPGFTSNDFDVRIIMKIFTNAGKMVFPKTVAKNIHSFYDGRFIVYTMRFNEFMEYKLAQRFSTDYYVNQYNSDY